MSVPELIPAAGRQSAAAIPGSVEAPELPSPWGSELVLAQLDAVASECSWLALAASSAEQAELLAVRVEPLEGVSPHEKLLRWLAEAER